MKIPKIARRYLNEYKNRIPKWEEARHLIERKSVCEILYVVTSEISLYELHTRTGASVINLHNIIEELITMQIVERVRPLNVKLADGGRRRIFRMRRKLFYPDIPRVWAMIPPGIKTTPKQLSARKKLPTSYKL